MDGEHEAEGPRSEAIDVDADAGAPDATGVSPATWGEYLGGASDTDLLDAAVDHPGRSDTDSRMAVDELPQVDARIHADIIDEWYWAASHARIPQISGIEITSSDSLAKVRVTARLTDGDVEVASRIVYEGPVIAGVTDSLPSGHLALSAAYMVRVDERRGLECTLTLEDVSGSQTRVLDTLVRDVDVQPRDLFSWNGDPRLGGLEAEYNTFVDELNRLPESELDPENSSVETVGLLEGLEYLRYQLTTRKPIAFSLLTSFVRPNHPEVAVVAREAAELKTAQTGDGAFHAFQIPDPAAATTQVESTVTAVYETLRQRGISYSEPPPGWDYSHEGQRIRDHGEVARGGLGTCMDTTALLAATLEHVGMMPVLVCIPGHIFVGYWRQDPFAGPHGSADWHPDRPYIDDLAEAYRLLQMGFLGVIETTVLCGPDSLSAENARGAALQRLSTCPPDPGAFRLIDVVAARRAGISPLPTVNDRPDGTVEIVEYRPGGIPETAVVRPEPLPKPEGARQFVDIHPPRIRTWKGALLTLNATSALLNLRNGPSAQPLILPEEGLSHLEDQLHMDREFDVLSGFDLPEIFISQERPNAALLGDDEILQLLGQRKLYVQRFGTTKSSPGPIGPTKFFSELRSMSRKAKQSRDEKGMNPLFLTIGLLKWPDKGTVHDAPLILVPVRLQPRPRSHTLTLTLDSSSHVAPNYALIEWLRREHDLEIPELVEPQTDKAGIDVSHVLSAVRTTIAQAGLPFSVTHEGRLALLDLASFRMWQDLNLHAETFMANPLVNHLVHTPTDPFDDPAAAAAPTPDLESLSVPVPADAAQLEAVAWARQGRTFVLQGPPGTGKSQTITNMIAESISAGLKVMFVAEKQTALSVVQRRLNASGLEPFALNLHHEGSSAAQVRDQLKASLKARGQADSIAMETAQRLLRNARFQLGKYPQDLHATNEAGLSAYSARDRLLALGEGPSIDVPIQLVARDRATIDEVTQALRNLQPVASAAAVRGDHPWRLAGAQPVDRIDLTETGSALERLLRACAWADGCEPALREALGAVTRTDQFADLAAAANPGMPAAETLDWVLDPAWGHRWREALDQSRTIVEQWQPSLKGFSPDVLRLDLPKVKADFDAAGTGMAFTRKSRRLAALAPVAPYAAGGVIDDPVAFGPHLDTLIQMQQADRYVCHEVSQVPGTNLPAGWNPFTAGAMDAVRAQLGRLEDVTDPLRPGTEWVATLRALARSGALARNRDALADLAAAWSDAVERLAVDVDDLNAWREGRGLVATALHHRGRWESEIRHDRLLGLQRWTALAVHLECLRAGGLGELRASLLDGSQPVDQVEEAFARGIAAASLRERITATGLDHFDSAGHDTRVKTYSAAQRNVRKQWVTSGPSALLEQRGGTLSGLFSGRSTGGLARELQKTRQLLGTRALLRKHGKAVQELMPVTLISPSAVVDLIEPGVMDFDLVIFDEASQITVPEAIGAMGRAKAVVVVGDSRQMPPSKRVGATSAGDAELEDDAEEQVEDQESILSECELARVPTLRLSWHYRSQDEALIAFSNRAYYEGALSSFPTPTLLSSETGVEFRSVNGQYLTGTRERKLADSGAANTNPQEAEAIVADVMARIEAAPDRRPSLGIVTFNEKQRDLIEAMLTAIAEDHAGLKDVMDEGIMGPGEALFVKALEQVQGDERDVILFSVAFSKGAKGKVPLNFGRLSNLGGERRLNVAVTRARRKNVVFCSFQPGDLEAEKSAYLGVKHLKDFLTFAQQLSSTAAGRSEGSMWAPVSDRHRDEIAAALRERGMVLSTDVGMSDFRLDILLYDPEDPTRPILPVLLDGEAWRQRRTVSDRDVLPVEVLVDVMGWPSVARVWWPMWLLNRETAIEQVLEAFDQARARLDEKDQMGVSAGIGDPGEAEPKMSSSPTVDVPEALAPDPADSLPPVGLRDLVDQPTAEPWRPIVAEPQPAPATPSVDLIAVSGPPIASAPDQAELLVAPGGDALGVSGLAPLPMWDGGAQEPVESVDIRQLADVLEQIVRIEGPMYASLAYRRYRRASGGQRLGPQVKRTFNQAMSKLIRSGRVAQIEDDVAGQIGKTVHAPGTPPVIVRELGDRALEEVPYSEVRKLMQQILDEGVAVDAESVKRRVLKEYGRTSLTRAANDYLDKCAQYEWRQG